MGDVVVTVPRAQWPAWLREGDLPGQAARGVSHFWLAPPLPPMAPGERVYVVASNRLRGYAPLVGVEERCTLRSRDGMGCLMRAGGAVAVTVLRYFPAFQGWRDRFWDRAEEVPFPRWQDLHVGIPDPEAPPYVPGAPCHRCGARSTPTAAGVTRPDRPGATRRTAARWTGTYPERAARRRRGSSMSGGRQSWLAVESYEDSGCPDLGIPSCLSCPLPACRLDLSPKQAGALVRQMRLVALLDQGLTSDELAAQMGVSRRTIYRLKAAAGRTRPHQRPPAQDRGRDTRR